MVLESWLSRMGSGLRARRQAVADDPGPPEAEKAPVGVLAFEVGSLMARLVQLWHSLADEQIVRLRDETLRLPGVRNLVSDDDDCLLALALAEILDDLADSARAVARLGRRCSKPALWRLEHLFADWDQTSDSSSAAAAAAAEWEYRLKKMKRRVKKMQRFVSSTATLYQEMEVLTELEQGLRRMQANGARQGSFTEIQRKIICQKQEIKHLREDSLWIRSYDYVVRLLTRSLFTILGRTNHVFGIFPVVGRSSGQSPVLDHIPRSKSVSATGQSLGHPSETDSMRFASSRRQWGSKTTSFGCMTAGMAPPTPVLNRFNGFILGCPNGGKEGRTVFSLFSSKRRKLLNAPPWTLGAAALALQYANIIVVIEKMAICPHFIAPDARDDLYDMLPTSIRAALRARLTGSPVYDAALEAEWRAALRRTLEWLAPLAHNMIRWQSERSFEQQHLISKTTVLLLQTLYFADQATTETVITELLVGLSYLSRFPAEPKSKAYLAARGRKDHLDDSRVLGYKWVNA